MTQARYLAPPTLTADAAHSARRTLPNWARIFLSGLALWAATVLVTFLTGTVNLVPTIILLGSFLVPVTFVVYVFGRTGGVLTAQRIFAVFLYGGVLGVLGATILEAALLRQPSGLGYVGVGLIEEAVKLGALWVVARRLPHLQDAGWDGARCGGRDLGVLTGAAALAIAVSSATLNRLARYMWGAGGQGC